MIGLRNETSHGTHQSPSKISSINITSASQSNSPNNQNVSRASTRERTIHAVEYYNCNVLRARVGAGLTRNSVHERHNCQRPKGHLYLPSDHLYRSNSSLELIHDTNSRETSYPNGTLRREYGSHGSIDVISSNSNGKSTSDNFFAMLQDYTPAVLNLQKVPPSIEDHESPKLKTRFQKMWSNGKQPSQKTVEDVMNNSTFSTHTVVSSADIEERQRRRAFAHYDCQSLTANLGYAAKLRGLLLARRRNTQTGASAAAASLDEDVGDGIQNELVENCPFFRNEVGGEEEREVSLTRMQSQKMPGQQCRSIHRPSLAYGVALLECPVGEILWKQITCPFQRGPRPIEQIDHGARYYRNYFLGQEHQNWFGMDEQLGPIAISIKKEKVLGATEASEKQLFRLILRTSELLTLRGSIIEDSIPNPRGSGKAVSTKEVLEFVAPEVQISCLKLGINTPQCEQQLLKLDEQGLTNKYKVGILYCRANQSTEEEMYNNENAEPPFIEFLETIGKRVRLKGFDQYKAGLDNKTDSTGTHSVYSTYQDCEIMFHVSTMLPFTPNNRQQLLRKRHIGNY